ncbi:hypothetical protein OHA79_49505 (plasmid) [Streptomyces sp. NBC_00841]|nr:hypothetical protein [Streptomyces sp. NBC_00841]WSA05528.1 hypothetical protein OHA79_49505 [Streptomyces sp. NBC_00841]
MDSVELKGMTVGERAKEGAQRGRGTGTCEHGRHRPVPQDVKVVDAVRTRGHAGHNAGDLGVRRSPRPVLRAGQFHLRSHQVRQAAPLGQP